MTIVDAPAPTPTPTREVWPGKAYPLGAAYDGAGTNFTLFSEVAERVELCLFDADGAETRLADALAKADIRGVKLTATKPHITLAGVQVTPAGLAASAIVAMALDIELTAGLIGD